MDYDLQVRVAAFNWLSEHVNSIGDVLPRKLLEKGFESVDNWYSSEELSGLRTSLLRRYEKQAFAMAGIGKNQYHQREEKIRNDQILWLNKTDANDFENRFFEKMDDFVIHLNRTCFAGIRDYEFHYAVFEKGAFFKKHADRFKNDDRRQFSFVSYLTENWQKGDGGEIILYANGQEIKIEPIPGRVIFFSADLQHEVLPTNIQRLSLAGWLKTG